MKPGSARWNRELRRKQKLAALSATAVTEEKTTTNQAIPSSTNLPTCPKCLPKPVQAAWCEIVMDALAAGVSVKQFDSRAFVVAAGQQVDLYALESRSGEGDLSTDQLCAVIGRKEQVRRSLIQTLVAIGGTPLVRARILGMKSVPEKKPGVIAQLLAAKQARK